MKFTGVSSGPESNLRANELPKHMSVCADMNTLPRPPKNAAPLRICLSAVVNKPVKRRLESLRGDCAKDLTNGPKATVCLMFQMILGGGSSVDKIDDV